MQKEYIFQNGAKVQPVNRAGRGTRHISMSLPRMDGWMDGLVWRLRRKAGACAGDGSCRAGSSGQDGTGEKPMVRPVGVCTFCTILYFSLWLAPRIHPSGAE